MPSSELTNVVVVRDKQGKNGYLPSSATDRAKNENFIQKSQSFQNRHHQQKIENNSPIACNFPYNKPRLYSQEQRFATLPENVPEPDYSQSDSDNNASLRHRNSNYWANSSNYHQNHFRPADHRKNHEFTGYEFSVPQHRPPPNRKNSSIDGTTNTTENGTYGRKNDEKTHKNSIHKIHAPSTRKNQVFEHHNHAHNHQKIPTILDDRYFQNENSRKTVSAGEENHVTKIILTENFSAPEKNSARKNEKIAHFSPRNAQEKAPQQHSSSNPPSKNNVSLITVDPNSNFSNVNLLKRVNDRYKLTERLLLQMKIIALLHAFFGLCMLALDSSHAIIVWPFANSASQRLKMCLRNFYSLGVIFLGCLTFAVTYSRYRSTLLKTVKQMCIVVLLVLLIVPIQTPLFQTISECMEYNEAIKQKSSQSQREDPLETIRPNTEIARPTIPLKPLQNSSAVTLTTVSTNQDALFNDFDANAQTQSLLDGEQFAKNAIRQQQKIDARIDKGKTVAHHLRIAYCIVCCCHILVTVLSLILLSRLERLS